MKTLLFGMILILATLMAVNVNAGIAKYASSTALFVGGEILPVNKIRKTVIVQVTSGSGTVTIKPDSAPANDLDGIVMQVGALEFAKFEMVNSLYAKSSEVSGTLLSTFEILE